MSLLLKGKIRSGYIIASLLLLISYVLIFYSTWRLQAETEWVSHSYVVINKVELLNKTITEAETGVRGYIITRDENFLKSYSDSKEKIPLIINDIKNLVIKDQQQEERFDNVQKWLVQRLASFPLTLNSFDKAGQQVTPEMAARRKQNVEVMDSLQKELKAMADAEELVMKQKKSKLSGFFNATQIITIISLIIAIIAIIYSLITYNQEKKAKSASDKKAKQYGEKLENTIIELENTNAELKELRSIEKFAATGRITRTMAHEVRNPLTNISLAAEQLKEMSSNNEESTMLLNMISRNAERINQLVANLLNATKFGQLNVENIEVNELLEDTMLMAKDRIDLNHITVQHYFTPESCIVSVDVEKIKLAFLNIIVNALEAMENDKGLLTLKTRKEKNKCVIEIGDNGTGIDEDTLHKLFEPYFTSKPKGNGLGLTNTQNIILNHNGSIKVVSRINEGTTFIIKLNLHKTTE